MPSEKIEILWSGNCLTTTTLKLLCIAVFLESEQVIKISQSVTRDIDEKRENAKAAPYLQWESHFVGGTKWTCTVTQLETGDGRSWPFRRHPRRLRRRLSSSWCHQPHVGLLQLFGAFWCKCVPYDVRVVMEMTQINVLDVTKWREPWLDDVMMA